MTSQSTPTQIRTTSSHSIRTGFRPASGSVFPGKITPSDPLSGFRCGSGAETYTNYCDPQFDALVADALSLQTTDIAAANDKWAQADHMLVDAAPWALLFNEGSDFVSERVGNYQYHLFYGALLDQMWVQ